MSAERDLGGVCSRSNPADVHLERLSLVIGGGAFTHGGP
jgi:hypothetical protein